MPDDLSPLSHVLKNVYGDALREQIEYNQNLFERLGFTAPVFIPPPRWKRFLLILHYRLNACYMHLRYGECDTAKAFYEQD